MLLLYLLNIFHLLLGFQNTVLFMYERFNGLHFVFMMLKCSQIHIFVHIPFYEQVLCICITDRQC